MTLVSRRWLRFESPSIIPRANHRRLFSELRTGTHSLIRETVNVALSLPSAGRLQVRINRRQLSVFKRLRNSEAKPPEPQSSRRKILPDAGAQQQQVNNHRGRQIDYSLTPSHVLPTPLWGKARGIGKIQRHKRRTEP